MKRVYITPYYVTRIKGVISNFVSKIKFSYFFSGNEDSSQDVESHLPSRIGHGGHFQRSQVMRF